MDRCFSCLCEVRAVSGLSGLVYHRDYAQHLEKRMAPQLGEPVYYNTYYNSRTDQCGNFNSLDNQYDPANFKWSLDQRRADNCVAYATDLRPFLRTPDSRITYWMPKSLRPNAAHLFHDDKLFLDYVYYLNAIHPARWPSQKTFHKFIKLAHKTYPSRYYDDDVEE